MNTFIGTQRDLPRSDAPLSLRAARTHHVLDRAPQVFPSPQGCKLGSARSWPTGSPGSRLGYGPEVRRKPFGFHLAMDTLPSARIAAHGRRVLLGLLSTHPPCEGAAGLSPARESPCWAHSLDYSNILGVPKSCGPAHPSRERLKRGSDHVASESVRRGPYPLR